MIIGINALSIFPGVSGGGETYFVNLIKHLSIIDKKNQYFLFVNDTNHHLFPGDNNFIKIFCPASKKRLLFRIIWEQLFLPFYVKKHKIDLLFSPTNISPVLWLPSKLVLNICDIYWAHFGECFSRIEYLFLKYLILLSAIKADKIISISEYTKTEIVKYTKASSAKIKAVYLGRGNILDLNVDFNGKEYPLLKKIEGKYILTVGRTHQHKNYINLIAAFKILRKNKGFSCKLVISGIPGRQHNELMAKIKSENLESEIFLTGWVDNHDLYHLYKKAELFVFPSTYEGFGLPLLEAMSFGIPVVCSNITALPEIGGDAVLCFDPLNVNDIAEKISIVLSSDEIKNELIEKGKERVKFFNWEETARQTLKVFEETCNNTAKNRRSLS